MKCSPFSRKGGKHMHGPRGIFMKHIMRRCMDRYSSTSSSSSEDECHRNQQIESGKEKQQKMKHYGMKSKLKHDIGMNHHHGMMHGRESGCEMMHGMRHGHGMRHRRHGMKHWKHGKGHDHFMEHRIKHRHGMKHKMHHGHGRKHKMGHGHHKFEKVCDQNEEIRPLEVKIGNREENSESEAFTFYKPKTDVQIINENNKFQICLDTSHYQPEEVSVKIVEKKIDVSAMHESMEDNIYEFHEMYRSFDIPENVNPEVIAARLNADGKLIIEASSNNQREMEIVEGDESVDRERENNS